jgi:transposase InsO family protein
LEGEFATDLLCEALCLSRAGYYRYRQGSTFKENEEQAQQVKKVFSDHKRRYGSRRIVAELKAQGKAIGRWCVRKQMKKLALQAIQPRRFVPKTTDSAHGKRNSPNLLLNQLGERLFRASAPNQVWYSDITYLPMQGGGFTYLCLWTDLFSRKIVGWQIEETMEEQLVIRALEKAFRGRQPPKGLILHSDRGGQYVSGALRKLMKDRHSRQSMSRADNCYDNAVGESLFSRFKAELMQKGTFLSLEDARTEIFEYIEIYYNRVRRHSSLGYQSPE